MESGSFGAGTSLALSPDLQQLLRRAFAAYNTGDFAEAENSCRQVVAADGKQFDAEHLLGLIEFQRGHFEEADRFIRRALGINPRSAHAYSNLGLVLQQLNHNEDALAALEKALEIEPDHQLALNNHGYVLWKLNRPEDALKSLDRALTLNPNYVDALCNKGNVLLDLRRLEQAITNYDRSLAIFPHDALTLNNRANALWLLDRRDEAMSGYDNAFALAPQDLTILKDRGSALFCLCRGEEALHCFDRALELEPNDPDFLYRRGKALAQLERYDEAINCFEIILAVQPDNIDALNNCGHALVELERVDEALAHYNSALSIEPNLAETHWHLGCVLRSLGNYEQGWKEYEWRWRVPGMVPKLRILPEAPWLGDQPIRDKTILLHAEQGFGDTIQFIRYVALLAAQGANVLVEVQPELKALFSCLDGVGIFALGEDLPHFDLHCPLLSLPLAFKTRLETIPAPTSYLSAPSDRLTAWNKRLPKTDSPRIGVVWAGNQRFSADGTRSIGLRQMSPLLSLPGLQFVSLQKDLRPDDAKILSEHSDVFHLGAELNDFADTAAIVSSLDLVISSDTAVAHLAGALGRPVWVLLERVPDWRWLVKRRDSPWYPSARLFRQPSRGNWPAVVQGVAEELAILFAGSPEPIGR